MQQGGPSSSFLMSPTPYRARRPRVFLGQVERLENPARGEDLEGTLGEAVHALHRLVVVELAPQIIELAQERATARQPLGRDRLVVEAQPGVAVGLRVVRVSPCVSVRNGVNGA